MSPTIVRVKIAKQCGAVLIVSLIFLTVMTMFGVTAMSFSSLEEKMAGNMKDKTVAFEAAEAALRRAESYLDCLGGRPIPCVAGPCASAVWQRDDDDIQGLAYKAHGWWTTNTRDYTTLNCVETAAPTSIVGVNTQPRYLMEELRVLQGGGAGGSLVKPSGGGSQYFYLITAYGTGANDAAQAVVQSVYATRFAN